MKDLLKAHRELTEAIFLSFGIENGYGDIDDKTDMKWDADHIIPHSYGAPTIVENGQLINREVNGNKSSGVTIDDVKLICERMNYPKVDSLIDMFETNTSELLPEDIDMVVKKVFKS